MKTEIVLRLQVEGIHNWPECDIEEVGYLKFPHRHTFHIECVALVAHAERDIEFIKLGHLIRAGLQADYYDDKARCLAFGSMSCESIAMMVLEKCEPLTSCAVFEDGEHGARVTR